MLGESFNVRERKLSRNSFGFQCVQEMGNGKANRLYEAYLPENFRRPQTDQHPFFFFFSWKNTEPFHPGALWLKLPEGGGVPWGREWG